MIRLPISGRFAAIAGFEFCATRDSFRRIASILRESDLPVTVILEELCSGCSPSPYPEMIESLVVGRTEGKILIERTANACRVSGSAQALLLLADNIDALAADEIGTHLHLEYHPDHYYLDETAEPIVLRIAD
jgi:hypothetical protein